MNGAAVIIDGDVATILEEMVLPAAPSKMSWPGTIARRVRVESEFPQDGIVGVEAAPYDVTMDDEVVITGLVWNACRSVNRLNQLFVNSEPLIARELQFRVEQINWRTGEGWPLYNVYCPNRDIYNPQMLFPEATVHQIVPSCRYWDANGERHWVYYPECPPNDMGHLKGPDSTESPEPPEWFFSVNDDYYDDNVGRFWVVVTGWSK
jgi:hypothetical protein